MGVDRLATRLGFANALGTQRLSGILGTIVYILILLPVISALLFITGLLGGLYLYRWDRERPLAFIIWLSSSVCALLFLVAVLFLVTTPI